MSATTTLRGAAARRGAAPCMDSNLRTAAVCLIFLAASGLQACSSQQAYGVGQAWQRNECYKISDPQERSRCLASASTSYDDYKRQAEAGNKVP